MSAAPRQGEARDGVLGAVPRIAVEPASLEEAAEAMRAFARDRLAVAFVGGGTDLELGAPPARLDAVLRTAGMSAVREHAPSDQIVAVGGGMTVAALQRHLAPHGQRLALDPPFPERATVGGVLAANAFGPRRSRYGSVRDLVIGITIVRADGVLAHGGGKVVKNVAGFDLPRLLCGSLGSLGLVAEVVFRLHPLPEASATAVFDGLDAAAVAGATAALRELGVDPSAVGAFAEGTAAAFRLGVRFEGFAPGVREQIERTLAKLGGEGRVDGDSEAAFWARVEKTRAGNVRAKAAFGPGGLGRAVDALRPLAAALRSAEWMADPATGLLLVGGDLDDGAACGRAVEGARAALGGLGNGTLVLAAAPPELRAKVDVWGPAPSGIEVMRRLKRELDPDGRLAPGRLVGGI